MLIANVAGCAAVGAGEIAMPLFCTATAGKSASVEWFSVAQAILLLASTPILMIGIFASRFRVFSLIVATLALGGLSAQYVLLKQQVLWCDAP